jgi:hypothetical protein
MQQRSKGARFGSDVRALTPVEEKVLRMRHGIKARGFTRLESWCEGNPSVAQQLAEIEKRLLAVQSTPAEPRDAQSLRAVPKPRRKKS